MVFYDLSTVHVVNFINLSPHCPPTLPLCPPKTLRVTFLHTSNWNGQQWVWQNIRWQFSVWTNFKTQIKFCWTIRKCVDIPSHLKWKCTTGEEWQTESLAKHSMTVCSLKLKLIFVEWDIPSHFELKRKTGEDCKWAVWNSNLVVLKDTKCMLFTNWNGQRAKSESENEQQ